MATCPVCNGKQSYWKLVPLYFFGRRRIVCARCHASLIVNKFAMIPYFMLCTSVAAVLGLTMVFSHEYLKWFTIFLIWIVITMLVQPLVLRLKTISEE